MKKLFLSLLFISLLVITLSACSPSTNEASGKYLIPQELADCLFLEMYARDMGGKISVVRCPNSNTSTIAGDKAKTTTIVIDGVEYAPIENKD